MAEREPVIGPNGEVYTDEDLERIGRMCARAFLHNGFLGAPVPEEDAEIIRQRLARES